jgi:hypothetical protein
VADRGRATGLTAETQRALRKQSVKNMNAFVLCA